MGLVAGVVRGGRRAPAAATVLGVRGAARLDLGDQPGERAAHALPAVRPVLADLLPRSGEALVQSQVVDLLLEAACQVVDAERARARVARLDQIKKVRVRGALPERVVAAPALPSREPGLAEVQGRVALDVGEGGQVAPVVRGGVQVVVVLGRGEEGEEVLLELQAEKVLGAEVAVVARAGRVGRVPGLRNGLVERVDPAAVGDGEGEGGAEAGGGDGKGVVVELRESAGSN